ATFRDHAGVQGQQDHEESARFDAEARRLARRRVIPREPMDPFDLERFVQAQEGDYKQALSEVRSGRKLSHWMWYIFPQIEGLGSSSMSRRYSLKSVEEAKAYLGHPLLGPRLVACAKAVVDVHGRSAREIFGSPDDMKLRSCATLFASVSPEVSVFH